MKRMLVVFGTRPEAIKTPPMVFALRKHRGFDLRACVPAQHRQMLDQVLELFGIQPDLGFDLVRAGQSPAPVTSGSLEGIGTVDDESAPDLALVHGATTTIVGASLAAFYRRFRSGTWRRACARDESRHAAPRSGFEMLVQYKKGIGADRDVEGGWVLTGVLRF